MVVSVTVLSLPNNHVLGVMILKMIASIPPSRSFTFRFLILDHPASSCDPRRYREFGDFFGLKFSPRDSGTRLLPPTSP